MNEVAEVERQDWAAPRVEELRAALREAADTQLRLARALRALDRSLARSRSAEAAHHAQQVALLYLRIQALTADMRTMREWSLEMAHFLESWHPVGPSFASDHRSPMGGRLD